MAATTNPEDIERHRPSQEGARCRPFNPGQTRATRHGTEQSPQSEYWRAAGPRPRVDRPVHRRWSRHPLHSGSFLRESIGAAPIIRYHLSSPGM